MVFVGGALLAAVPAITGFGARSSKAATPTTITCPDGSTVTDVTDCPATPPDCNPDNHKLLGIIPPWYQYFGDDYGVVPSSGSGGSLFKDTCGIIGGDVTDHILQVGLAIIDMALRAGALVAVAFIVMGGYRYMSSQGEPKNIEAAMATIINAAIGLGIVVTATVLVSFIGHSLGG